MLNLQKTENTTFNELNDYVLRVKKELSATAVMYRTVAVRIYNQTGSNRAGYDCLEDIKTFGNLVNKCARDL